MEISQEYLKNRLPVWKALSNLFLDTELDQSDYRYIVKEIEKSGFSRLETQEILWKEVFPALADNLRIVAGEWGGFSDKWLQNRILNVMNGSEKGPGFWGLMTVKQTQKIIDDTWNEVQSQLSSGSQESSSMKSARSLTSRRCRLK